MNKAIGMKLISTSSREMKKIPKISSAGGTPPTEQVDLKNGKTIGETKEPAEVKSKCMFCGLNTPISQDTAAEDNGLNWEEYSAHPGGFLITCWDCKNNHVSVMSNKKGYGKVQ